MIAVAIEWGIVKKVNYVAFDFDAALDYVTAENEQLSGKKSAKPGARMYRTGVPFYHQWIFQGIKPNLEHCLCGYIKAAKEIEAIHGNIFIPGGILLSGGM